MNSVNLKKSFFAVLTPYICSHAIFWVIILLVSSLMLVPVPAREGLNYHLVFDPSFSSFIAKLKTILLSADGFWYIEIAEIGYDSSTFTSETAKNWVFFPLFPSLVSLGSSIIHKTLSVALLLNAFFFLLSLMFLYNLAQLLGFSEKSAQRSLWAICMFPASIFINTPITESLFLLLLVSCFYYLYTNRIYLSGLCMFASGLTRPTGLMLYFVFLLALYEKGYLNKKQGLIVAGIAPLGTLIFIAYLYNLTGNGLAFIDNQVMWGRHLSAEGSFASLVHELLSVPVLPWNPIVLNFAYLVLALSTSIFFIRRKKISLALLVIIPPCFAMSTGSFMFLGRYIVPLFPVFLACGYWSENKNVERTMMAIFSTLFAIYTLGYALHITAFMA